MNTLIGNYSRNIHFIIILAFAIIISYKVEAANNIEFLSKTAIKNLQSSVFEVVIPKKENKNIEYAKKLPLHTLSFKKRNEKFYSIGTAFFINSKELMSAAHVFNLQYFSLFGLNI